MSSEIHLQRRQRRQRVLNRLGDGLLVLPTAPVRMRNGDVPHPFRPDSDFYYLTGFEEPDAVLVAFRKSSREHVALLFLRDRDPEREIWDGRRLGPRKAVRTLGIDKAYSMASLYDELESLLRSHPRMFYTLGAEEGMDRDMFRIFERNRIHDYRGNPPSHPEVSDPRPAIATERLTKDGAEIETIERAAEVSASGHREAMRAARPGMMEYELQAELEASFRRQGSKRNGYESIVASGTNACVLHYIENQRRMQRDDLVLIDAGAEIDNYTADITRTFPVSGTFTPEQAEVYRIVLRAQKAAIRAVSPGKSWQAPHAKAVSVVVDGLRKLGILRGPKKRLVESNAYKPWFMHGTSHWLGLDVHDAGGYRERGGRPAKLRAGMVLTVEPGLYFGARDTSVPASYRGIGIRIEDDVLVTRSGSRVLTDDVPKEIRDIERLCQS